MLRVSKDLILKAKKNEKDPIYSINLWVILSQLGKHEEARDNAINAIVGMQDSIFTTFVPKVNQKKKKLDNDDPELIEKEFKEKIVVLSVCYRNLATEYEYLKGKIFTCKLNHKLYRSYHLMLL